MKRILVVSVGFISMSILIYFVNPRVRFYAHYGIWLPSFCEQIEFTKTPDLTALLGMDGLTASAKFEIGKNNIESFVNSMRPQDLWLKYGELDSKLADRTIHTYKGLPKDVLDGKIKVMLWSSETKGDYYNIWLIPSDEGRMKVTISMPFT